MKTLLWVVSALAVAGLLAAGGTIGWFIHDFRKPGPLTAETAVVVPPGSTLGAAARSLDDAGVINDRARFLKQVRRLTDGAAIQAGEYRFPARVSAADAYAMMVRGDVVHYALTIPEGWPAVKVQAKLMAAPALTGEVAVPDEGSVLPDTYSYTRGETRAAVLRRMQAAMRTTLAKLWAGRAPGLPLATPQEALTLASIVEKETGKPSEYGQVAGVYVNRLKRGMLLQADPTVIYPITKGLPLGRRIRLSELRAVNGYNTYARAGLPVGPIANPGRSALKATLNPARTDALYFVADGSGGHVFATTLEAHNRNVARWRRFRAEQGI